MARKKARKKQESADTVIILKGVLTVIFTVVMIMAIAGMYFAHVTPNGVEFGTINGSLSILALVLAIIYWTRHADISSSRSIPRVEEWLTLVILLITFIVSIISIVKIHFNAYGPPFGTTESSLSIVAFAIAAKHMAKHVQWMLGRWVPPYPRKCK